MMNRARPVIYPIRNSPCDGCEKRNLRCHGTCKDYRTFSEKCEEIRKDRLRNREVDEAVADAMKRLPGKREI